jgi:protein-S-isoprenylcysteine O-methyltransferase Ste14
MESTTGERGFGRGVGILFWARAIASQLMVPVVLFACAGDLAWWQGWALSISTLVVVPGGWMAAERRNPGLMMERELAKSGAVPGIKDWDRILAPLMALSMNFPPLIVAALDRRFGWSPGFPAWLAAVGLAAFAAGQLVAAWALVENRFLSSLVRIQEDRGHAVCDTGPYRFVRHPFYAGGILNLAGVAPALGSIWALVPVAVALVLVVARTRLEDWTLRRELPGYAEYALRVRYRLVPGIY